MSYDKQKVIDIALAEVGYLEKNSKSNLDNKTAGAGDKNYTMYARDLDAMNFYNGRKQGFAWCDVFVDWCFVEAYGKTNALKLTCQPTKAANNCGAGCNYSRKYYKNKGQLHDTPEVGDQIFFYGTKNGKVDKTQIAHTGLVYKVDKTYVYTVEGNTSSTSGVVANGGGVFKKKYKLTNSRLAGYGRPAYGEQEEIKEKQQTVETAYTTYTVKRGDTLWDIAKKHLGRGNRYKEIKTLNGLKSDVIRTGQKLKLPKA